MARHTDGAVLDSPAPEPATPERRSSGDRLRLFARGIGQTFITVGLIVLLFVFYEVYVTNWFSDEAQHKVREQITKIFESGDDPTLAPPGSSYPDLPLGKGIANLYIPRLGRDYEYGIVEGTGQDELAKGPGHYRGTALPGQLGNFSIAGHRVGKGEPFLNLDQLRPGDAVIVETESHFYVYRIKGTDHGLTQNDSDGIPGREIVDPSDNAVINPVPDHPLGTPVKERLLTMTTCHPKFTAQQRMILHAVIDPSLTYAKPKGTSPMSAQIRALFTEVS